MTYLHHPVTEAPLDPENEQQLRRALADFDDYLSAQRKSNGPKYDARDAILAQLAEKPYPIPPRRQRTQKQDAISRCPRCRGRIEAAA